MIDEPAAETLHAALRGDYAAVDTLLRDLQPGIYNLARRMLGQADDAADATQEILLRVLTHLASFRAEAAFSTWVWRIAYHHLLQARTRAAEAPVQSLEALAEKLQAGLDFAAHQARASGEAVALTPEDKLEARQIGLACTQSMLMALDREHRAAYVLDEVFFLPSAQSAEVLGISPEAFRKRLSRARARLNSFRETHCGLASPSAACRCERQLPAYRVQPQRRAPEALQGAERMNAEQAFERFLRLSDAAELLRSQQPLTPPRQQLLVIRALLVQQGWVSTKPSQ